MPEKGREKEVLLALAERLPEKVLEELLPGIDPENIRSILQNLAGRQLPSQPSLQSSTHPCGEKVPTHTPCTLFSDGASRGNPGEAGAGVVLVGPDNTEIGTRSLYLGQCTNNAAEYQGLIAGLELALHHGCKKLRICLDSELIVRQLQGVYKVRNEQLKPFFGQAQGLLRQLDEWKAQHVPRSQNQRADQLANQGIDNRDKE